jgi:hypothetical protein
MPTKFLGLITPFTAFFIMAIRAGEFTLNLDATTCLSCREVG